MVEPLASPGTPISTITLSRGTGGLDQDGVAGDEGILVVLVPQDEDLSAIKIPGTASILLTEITSDGVKIPFTSWEVSSSAMRASWQSGLFGSGYHLKLRWASNPTQTRVRISVQFRTLDGRVLETDKDISIRPTVMNGMPAISSVTSPQNTLTVQPQPLGFQQQQGPIVVPKAPIPQVSTLQYPQPNLGPYGPPVSIDAPSSAMDGPLLPVPMPVLQGTSQRISHSAPIELYQPIPSPPE